LLLELAILQLGMLGEDEVDKGVEVSYNILCNMSIDGLLVAFCDYRSFRTYPSYEI
jgi:hypothetical protein